MSDGPGRATKKYWTEVLVSGAQKFWQRVSHIHVVHVLNERVLHRSVAEECCAHGHTVD